MTVTETRVPAPSTAAPVPFVDLSFQTRTVADDVRRGLERMLESGAFVLGPEAEAFERDFARYSGAAHCIGVGNGTDAVELALRALGIGAGDEVVVPANTFVATAEAVLRAGAEVVLADCDEDYLVDPARVAERVTDRTRAVVGVHLYGQMAPVERLRELVPAHVHVVEDAAQSQGATRHGHGSGSLGDAAATSFYPGKNLGAFGDAGAVLTSDDDVASRVRRLRNHGGERRYEHREIGMNSRLDGLQATVLASKLAHLDRWNRERQEAAALYDDLLADLHSVVRPRVAEGNEHVWHLYVVQVEDRDAVGRHLGERGIGTGVHYPAPVHLLPAFAGLGLGGPGDFPVAERGATRILSLPMFPGITPEQQECVVDALRSAPSVDG